MFMKKMINISQKSSSLKRHFMSFLCVLLMFETVQTNIEAIQIANNGTVEIDGNKVNYTQKMLDNGDGTITYQVKLSSKLNKIDSNHMNSIAQNNYYEVSRSGTYLVEMWGGNGADGDSTRFASGGHGGKGGYVYATIDLKVGDVLFYTIGGNGIKTLVTDEGGGANGNGGGHGDIGSYNVGGGGGYSGLYLYHKGEFDHYLDANGELNQKSIDESDRKVKYIMIAAGGGGGGAGDGFSIYKPIGTADGGRGGSIGDASNSLGNGYIVPGIVFAGTNGTSSGKSYNYIGYGGNTLPGYIPETHIQLFKGKKPNNWDATANPNFAGGSGGSGNFRGGAGGAGFCGGSGGTMTTLLIPTNVGGGGGGSSFIANVMNISLSSDAQSKLKGRDNNPSQTGGSIAISYLGNAEKPTLDTFSISAKLSQYFEIVSTNGVNFDASTNIFNISNIELDPSGEPSEFSVTLKPKNGFAGGNNVPIFAQPNVSLKTNVANVDLPLTDSMLNVNVPVSFELIGKSLLSTKPGQAFNSSELYEDKYVDIRNDLNSHWEYHFIEEIGPVKFEDSSIGAQVAPMVTTKYPLLMDVRVKNTGIAKLGPVANNATIKSQAIITVDENAGIKFDEGNVAVKYEKDLKYVNGEYILSLTVDENTQSLFVQTPSPQEFNSNGEYIIPVDGYYMIEAWGGKGADGYTYSSHFHTYKGGKGNNGEHVKTYSFFKKDDVISYTIGKNGLLSKDILKVSTGGDMTSVTFGTNKMIAGGGGAGGNSGPAGRGGDAVLNDGKYDKFVGEDGAILSNLSAIGGRNGKNQIVNPISLPENPLTLENQTIYEQANATSDVGKVKITCLQNNEFKKAAFINTERMSNHIVDAQISKYFDVINVESTGTSTAGSQTKVENIQPTITHAVEGNNVISNAQYVVKYHLKPVAGFLGGNDVPLLERMSIAQNAADINMNGSVIGNVGSTGPVAIASMDITDFANVAINYQFALKSINQNYVIGDPGIAKNSLYEWTNQPDFNSVNAEFVKGNIPVDETLTPNVITTYPLTFSLKPKAPAQKAIVINKVGKVGSTIESTIYVKVLVVENLTKITSNLQKTNNRILADANVDLSFNLKADAGYVLPEKGNIEIKAGDQVIDDFTYDVKTGLVTIPGSHINQTITITAKANPIKHGLHYIYETEPGVGQKQYDESYVTGTRIPANTFANTFRPASFAGYHFEWDWATENNAPLEYMPANDYYVIGKYIPNEYDLIIKYYFNGDFLFSTVSQKVAYGATYNVPSPVKPGFVADITTVTGVMPAKNHLVEVHYTSTSNKLIVVYIKNDTKEEFERYELDVNTNETYEQVVSPVLDGYTQDKDLIPGGTMTANGVIEYVYYEPNQIEVTFNSGNVGEVIPNRTVIFNNDYGYNAIINKFEALPMPIRPGSQFMGWFLGEQQIREDSVVSNSTKHELVAKWKAKDYQLTIEYLFEDGSFASKIDKKIVHCGEEYNYPIPEIIGYEATINNELVTSVNGIGIAENQTIKVVYRPKTYTLTINYIDKFTNTPYADSVVLNVKYNEKYSVESPMPTLAYVCSEPLVEGVMPAEDKVINVYYTIFWEEEIVEYKVEWGDLTFDYTNGKWDPIKHEYALDSIAPHTDGQNTIKVINNSKSATIDVELTYLSNPQYRSLSGYFTKTNDFSVSKITGMQGILAHQSDTAYFWLVGSLDIQTSTTITSGNCTVVVREGDNNAN